MGGVDVETRRDPRAFHVPHYLPPLPTGADEAEPDASEPLGTQLTVTDALTDGLDVDSVERVRQSRLHRWQRQER